MKTHSKLPLILTLGFAAILCMGAAVEFWNVTVSPTGVLRGVGTNLFSANSNALNSSVNHAGGNSTNFRAGDGTFKPVSTNWITGLVSDIANILSSLAGKQEGSSVLTNLAAGNGSGVTTGINASALTSGTIGTSLLPATAVQTDRPQTFTANQAIASTANFTLGDMTVTNFPGMSLDGMSEWYIHKCEFDGSNATGAMNACGSAFQAANGGAIVSTSPVQVHPGMVYLQSAKYNGTSGGTWYFNSGGVSCNPGLRWRCDYLAYITNGTTIRIGIGNSVASSDPMDGADVVATNGVAVFRCRNNSVQVQSTNTFIMQSSLIWNTTKMFHTNNSPYALFQQFTNGVLQYQELVGGFPTNRTSSFNVAGYAFAAPATNTGVAVVHVDDTFLAIDTKGYR